MKTKKHHIICDGPCSNTQTLGTVELPADAHESQVAAALSGYLAEDCDCGPAYRHHVGNGNLHPGQIPTEEHVKIWRAFRSTVKREKEQ